jgi:hypothetical protein
MSTQAKILAKQGNQWVELDIDESVVIAVNKNIFDIRDITKRKNDYTKTIVFPATEKNNLFFANAYNINVDKLFDVKQGVDVVVYRNDVEVLRGKMYLLKINDNQYSYSYECTIVGNIGDVFKKLDALKLAEIWDSSDTFYYTSQAIQNQNSPPNNPALSSQYPVFIGLFDGGYAITEDYTNYKNLIPCVFVNRILEKAFNKVGYQLDPASILYSNADKRWKVFKYLMLVAQKEWRKIDYTTQVNNSMQVNNTSASSTTTNYYPSSFIFTQHILTANNEITDAGNHWNNVTNKISYTDEFILSIKLVGQVIFTSDYAHPNNVVLPVRFKVHFNDYNQYVEVTKNITFSRTGSISFVSADYTYTGNVDTIIQGIFANKINKHIYIDVEVLNAGNPYSGTPVNTSTWYCKFIQQVGTTIYAYPTEYAFGSSSIPISNLMPDISSGDFVRNFLKAFNLFYKIKDENIISIQAFETFYDKTNIIDISRNVDIQAKEQYIISDYVNRYIQYHWKNNNTYCFKDHKTKTNREYGDVEIDTGYLAKPSTTTESTILSIPAMLNVDGIPLPNLCDITEEGQKKQIDYGVVLCLWNGLVTPRAGSLGYKVFEVNSFDDNTLTNINNGNILPIASIDIPYVSHYWTDIAPSSWSVSYQSVFQPEFDLCYDTPKLLYYPASQTTNRNVYYSYFYRFWLNLIDKNSIIYAVNVAVPSHLPIELDRVYYFDNNYWLISKVYDWNVNHIDLAKIEFIKIIDTSLIEYGSRGILVNEFSETPAGANIFARTIRTSSITAESIATTDISTNRIRRTINNYSGEINITSLQYEVMASDIPFELIIPNSISVVGVIYRVVNTFNNRITLNLNGNTQIVQNANENGLLANVRNTINNTFSITSTLGVTTGRIIINILTI